MDAKENNDCSEVLVWFHAAPFVFVPCDVCFYVSALDVIPLSDVQILYPLSDVPIYL